MGREVCVAGAGVVALSCSGSLRITSPPSLFGPALTCLDYENTIENTNTMRTLKKSE
jgi:hypothetical protein